MGGLPDVLFVVDVGYEDIAVLEASKLGIPVVGIVDTNNSPDNIDYIVPGNDDSMRAIKLYTKMVADAILVGKESIVVAVNDDDEMIELDNEDAKIPGKASVKISTKKTARSSSEPTETDEAAEIPDVAEEVEHAEVVAENVVSEVVTPDEVVAEPEVTPAEAVAPKKAPVKKAATKKAVAKKAAPKKAATKKAATKKAAPKKAVTKKAVTKKAVAKKAAAE